MHIEAIRTLSGPNVFNHRPVLVMRLHLGVLAGRESCDLPGFIGRLLEELPGLSDHHCSRGRPGGFVERLHEGTYFGHVAEHVAIELSQRAGIPVDYGKTVYAGADGVYDVAVRYTSEEGMRCLLETAVALVTALVDGTSFPLEARVEEARRIAARAELGPSTRAIVEAAERRDIPWTRIGRDSLVQLGYGQHRRFIQAAATSATSQIAVDVASDKQLTKELLERAFLPVPRGRVVHTADEAVAALKRLGGAVVVKPIDGNQGKGVSVGLVTPEQVVAAFHAAATYARCILVEEQFTGTDYRVLVVGGRVVAACERLPCHVVGDGRQTIAALVEETNRDPRRGEGHAQPLTRIVVDDIAQAHLASAGHSLDDVPGPGERVFLRQNANLSTGGTARDVTDLLHPDVIAVCERAARTVGLDVCGVDLVVQDISRPIERGRGGIVEVNAAPGLRMHHYPSEGQARDAGDAIVDLLYPPGAPARIPIFSITGTNGKTTVTRMIGHVLAASGRTVGMTTTGGIYIGGVRAVEGDTTGPGSARVVLSDPSVEVAVLETARGGIVRRGLGYDWADVAVLTNIGPDHIGQDGIESIDDIVHIKSLVAERVREGGTLVLNADDERLVQLAGHPRLRRVPKQVVWFSLDDRHPLLRRHLDAGGTAFFLRRGWLVEAAGGKEHRLVRAAAIPVTLRGQAAFQVANSLAAAAACRAHGIPRTVVAAALRSFHCGLNAGRVSLFRLGGGHVLLDYGHNPGAFAAICRMAAGWRSGRRLVGIVGVPGDRGDELIEEAARVAACGFHRIVVREDADLRGRQPGEVAQLMAETIRREAPEVGCEVVHDAREALARELDGVRQGSIVVVFYDQLATLLDLLWSHGAVPVESVLPSAPAVSPAASSDGMATDASAVVIRPGADPDD